MKYVKWTFKSWISKFAKVDLPIGDLAADISADSEFPKRDDFGQILDYLQEKSHGNTEIVVAFCEAWNFYIVSTANPPHE